MAAMAELEAVEAAVSAISTAPLVLPEVPTHAPTWTPFSWTPAVAAAELPPPAPIQEQRALGGATPATFGDARVNAEHYLLGKGLYRGAMAQRYQDYHDGCWAYNSKPCFIYRFFVFEEAVSGPWTGANAADWKPIGLLNPHAYNAYKASGARGKTFLDFVDASQPASDVTAYWRPQLQRQNATASLSSPAGEAVAAVEPVPVAASTLDPRAESLKEEMDELEAAPEDQRSMPHCVRLRRLKEHWHGRWTTLPSGERALIWHFHAFAPPADGSYRTAQPLKHLGFYNYYDRSLSETTSCPVLPGQASWPW